MLTKYKPQDTAVEQLEFLVQEALVEIRWWQLQRIDVQQEERVQRPRRAGALLTNAAIFDCSALWCDIISELHVRP